MAPLAEAFVRVRADDSGVRKNIGKTFDGAGKSSGQMFSQAFTKDTSTRIRNSRGQFVKAGTDVGTSLGTGVTKASPKTGQKAADSIGSAMRSRTKKISGSIGASLGNGMRASIGVAAGAVAGAFAVSQIAGFFKTAIDGASDLAESTSKVNVVFGKASAQVIATSKSAAKAMGLSQQAYLGATGTLGNLLVSLDIAPKKAAGMSQQMVKLAGDLASFNNVSPEEALEALRAGLVGEAEPLKKFGVNMNDATLKAQALKMGLIKNTKEALNPQQKALAAQALIMAQTGTAQGDFARTSGGLANQQRILAAQFEDTKAKVGKALLPAMTGVVSFLNNKLIPGVGWARDAVKLFVGAFTGKGANVEIAGMNTIIDAGARVRVVFDAVTGFFKTTVWPILQRLGAFLLPMLSAAWADLKAAGQSVWVGLKQLGPVFKVIGVVIGAVLIAAVVAVVAAIRGLAFVIRNVIVPVARFLITVLRTVANFLLTTLGPVFRWLYANVIKPVWAGIRVAVKVAWTVLKVIFAGINWYVRNVLGPVFRWIYGNVIKPVFVGIRTVIKIAWNVVKAIFAVINIYIRGVLAPVFRWLYNNVIKPVWGGIKTTIAAVWRVVRPVLAAVGSFIKTNVAPAFRKGVDAIRSAWQKVQEAAAKPVRFVVNQVIAPLVQKFNAVSKKFGGPTVDVPHFATGTGDLTAAARVGWANRPTAIVGEGSRTYAESVIPTDPKYRGRALALWRETGKRLGMPLMESGGFLGRLFDAATDPGKAFRSLVASPMALLKKFTDTTFGKVVASIPRKILDVIVARIKKLVGAGGSTAAIIQMAKRMDGGTYTWGGASLMRNDCSGSQSILHNVGANNKPYFRRMFTTSTFGGGRNVGHFKRSLASTSPYRIAVNPGSHMWGKVRDAAGKWHGVESGGGYPGFRYTNAVRGGGQYQYGFQFKKLAAGGELDKSLYPFPLEGMPTAKAQKVLARQDAGRAEAFATGSWSVPRTGTALVHRKEMILQERVADVIRTAMTGNGRGAPQRLAGRPIEIHLHADGPSGFDERAVRRGVLSAMQTIDVLYGQGV